ncbi:hypothetical protein [Streptacidiphilus anmyonensis]|uniref:hypothetical protein n=1 Tax=Streptacidiphilus anmyonensis TaxID=405782 RepID=UPI0005A8628C|nr:hypothetical protein [Streptacidiphilus anmyonensis]
MFALPGAWEVLRAVGAHAVRGLAALEPRGWNRQAQRNAAAAAAASRAWRLDAEDPLPAVPAVPALVPALTPARVTRA